MYKYSIIGPMVIFKYSFVGRVKDSVSNNLNYFLHCHEINYEIILNTYIFTCLYFLNLFINILKTYTNTGFKSNKNYNSSRKL